MSRHAATNTKEMKDIATVWYTSDEIEAEDNGGSKDVWGVNSHTLMRAVTDGFMQYVRSSPRTPNTKTCQRR